MAPKQSQITDKNGDVGGGCQKLEGGAHWSQRITIEFIGGTRITKLDRHILDCKYHTPIFSIHNLNPDVDTKMIAHRDCERCFGESIELSPPQFCLVDDVRVFREFGSGTSPDADCCQFPYSMEGSHLIIIACSDPPPLIPSSRTFV